MADHKIYIFAGGHKIAEGKGEVMAADGSLGSAFDTLKAKTGIAAKSMQEMVDAYNSIKLREKMAMPEVPFPKEIPELSFRVKISKRRMRRLRQMAMGKKSRLPRKLKKAARHADFDVFDPQMQTDALSDRDRMNFTIEYDLRARIHPEGYPRTKWVRRLTNIVHRIMVRQHRRFMYYLLKQQFYNQHPGMLTYADAPINPAQLNKDLYAGNEMVLDRKHLTNLANIINKED